MHTGLRTCVGGHLGIAAGVTMCHDIVATPTRNVSGLVRCTFHRAPIAPVRFGGNGCTLFGGRRGSMTSTQGNKADGRVGGGFRNDLKVSLSVVSNLGLHNVTTAAFGLLSGPARLCARDFCATSSSAPIGAARGRLARCSTGGIRLGLRTCLSCGGAFNGRAMNTLLNCSRVCGRVHCLRTSQGGLPGSGALSRVGTNRIAARAACNARARCSLHSMFNHLGCSCSSHCLFRTGLHCSKASHFPGGGHFNTFPSFSMK